MGVLLVVGKLQTDRVVVHVDRKVVLTKVGRWSQTDTDFDAVGGHGEEGLVGWLPRKPRWKRVVGVLVCNLIKKTGMHLIG